MKRLIIVLSVLFFAVLFSSVAFASSDISSKNDISIADDIGIDEGNRLLQEFIDVGRNVTLAEFLEKVHPQVYADMDEQAREIAKGYPMWTKEMFAGEFDSITLSSFSESEHEIEPLQAYSTSSSYLINGGYGQITYGSVTTTNIYALITVTSNLYQIEGSDLFLRSSSYGVAESGQMCEATGFYVTDVPGDFRTIGTHILWWGPIWSPPGYTGQTQSAVVYVSPHN